MSTSNDNLCGPHELVAKLLEYRQGHQHPELYGNISNEGLSRLVVFSYFASQVVEEGRYPRFRLYVPAQVKAPPGWEDPWVLVRFKKPVVINEVDDLRRLSPCAASHDFAIEVQESCRQGEESGLECCGICLAHSGEGGTDVFSTSLWARRTRFGLMIRVDGPGELRVSEGHFTWDLRAGYISQLGSLPSNPLPLWLDKLAKKLAVSPDQAWRINHLIYAAWNELLHTASEQRRGACLVVLPKTPLTPEQVEEEYKTRLKYPTSGVGLGKAVADFVNSCLSSGFTDQDHLLVKDFANRWLRDRHRLLSQIESMAYLAGVDGSTIFDEDLHLIGFGGKIEAPSLRENKRLVDFLNNEPLSKEVMARTGTRHLSAYRLCQAHDEVSCYIVSQDGPVTAMWSRPDSIYRWTPVWPWAKKSDHI